MEKFIWEPGNATRYTVYLTDPAEGKRMLMLEMGYTQTWMFVNIGEVDHAYYIAEKLKLNTTDAKAIQDFLKKHNT